jgi:hypothetical protein
MSHLQISSRAKFSPLSGGIGNVQLFFAWIMTGSALATPFPERHNLWTGQILFVLRGSHQKNDVDFEPVGASAHQFTICSQERRIGRRAGLDGVARIR